MNLTISFDQFSTNHILFTEPKNNNVMDGHFTKILYSTDLFTMNEIYLCFPIKTYSDHYSRSQLSFNINYPDNQECIKEFSRIESDILAFYKENVHCRKRSVLKMADQLMSGNINLYSSHFYSGGGGGFKSISNVDKSNGGDAWISEMRASNKKNRDYNSADVDGWISDTRNRNYQDYSKYAMKISGVWETDLEVGITFKLVECRYV